QNTRSIPGSFRVTIGNQPVGGQASLKQRSLLTTLDVIVGARSSISRPVHVTSSDSRASVTVNVQEITTPGGTLVPGGLQASAVINPDRTNPDTVDPDNAPPGSSISSAESYNP